MANLRTMEFKGLPSRLALLLSSWALSTTTLAAEPSVVTRQEVAHLFSYLAKSGCQFQRNGTWHDAQAAASHLQQKYDYLLKKDLVPSTEAFIERGASQSSMSGKPYEVRCGQAAAVRSADWLRAELQRFRQARPGGA